MFSWTGSRPLWFGACCEKPSGFRFLATGSKAPHCSVGGADVQGNVPVVSWLPLRSAGCLLRHGGCDAAEGDHSLCCTRFCGDFCTANRKQTLLMGDYICRERYIPSTLNPPSSCKTEPGGRVSRPYRAVYPVHLCGPRSVWLLF